MNRVNPLDNRTRVLVGTGLCRDCGAAIHPHHSSRTKFCWGCSSARNSASIKRATTKAMTRACSAVANAVLRGDLPRLTGMGVGITPCTDCGKRAYHYDHRDYAKPLEVEPVCRSCNSRRGPGLNKHLFGSPPTGIPEVA